MPLCHTPHYPTSSFAPQILAVWPPIILVPPPTLLVILQRLSAGLVLFRNTYTCLTPNPRCFRQLSGVSPQKCSIMTTLRTYGCVYDQFALDGLSGNEKCVIYKSIHFGFTFLRGDKAESFSKTLLCALSNVLLLSCWRNQVAFSAEESLMNQASAWIKDEKQSSGLVKTGIPRGSVTLFFKRNRSTPREIYGVLVCVFIWLTLDLF